MLVRILVVGRADARDDRLLRALLQPLAAALHRAQEVAEFQTTVRGLLALRDWLKAHRVTQVAMEATGVYWKPVVRHEALFDRVGMEEPHLRVVAAAR